MFRPILKGLPATRVAALLSLAPWFLAQPAALAQPAPAPAPASSPLQQAVSALRSITTLTADFTQTDAAGQRVTGVLTLKNPGRIRFQYAPGYPMVIASDGRALTMLDTELRQMQRWPIGNSPLGALLDPARDVSGFGKVMPGFDPGSLGVAVKDRAHPEYGELMLVFLKKPAAPGGLELTAWVALDAQGRRTTVRLANHRYGLPVNEALFRLNNPAAGPHH